MKLVYGDRIGRNGKLAISCVGIVFNIEKTRILLVRRTDNQQWCLPGGFMQAGETIEEAIKSGIDAMNSWIETSQEFNDPVPEPGSSQASGRFVQRIPKSLHARLAARAKQEGVSMNALVTAIIAESLGKREAHQ